MKRAAQYFAGTIAVAAALLLFGFILFAVRATQEVQTTGMKADAIVVLTGAGNRILVGGQLLARRHAERLLISGVNRKVSVADVRRLSGLDDATFRCCVDIGYEAQDTIGNAEETRKWVQRLGVRRLIVVTSSYHMPRSLTELRAALPQTELLPCPVVPRALVDRPWWTSFSVTRTLAAEYLKLLPAAARFAVIRLLHPFKSDATSANVKSSNVSSS